MSTATTELVPSPAIRALAPWLTTTASYHQLTQPMIKKTVTVTILPKMKLTMAAFRVRFCHCFFKSISSSLHLTCTSTGREAMSTSPTPR